MTFREGNTYRQDGARRAAELEGAARGYFGGHCTESFGVSDEERACTTPHKTRVGENERRKGGEAAGDASAGEKKPTVKLRRLWGFGYKSLLLIG